MQTKSCLIIVLIGAVFLLSLATPSSAAPASTDMDQMEEMEVLGLVGCNHAVTVTALPLPGFTPTFDQRQRSEESSESGSASKESPSVQEMRNDHR
ncbi:AGAP008011-PA [Anopheles gambiae str. PEST]|uniref:AGAP008011-PA n=1 Tax=Anopheles gambiae TaxID=7165 RepID=A0NF72_ANOGA|nr:AGAP008011-PA [Anopheles gambiae str. PEST]